jgi:23S rRNA pseudouridine1911/1915/1917 synthase
MENKPFSPGNSYSFTVNKDDEGERIDRYLAARFPLYTRSFLQGTIRQGFVRINGKDISKSGTAVKEDDSIAVNFPVSTDAYYSQTNFVKNPADTEALGIKLIFEHPHFLIIYKPAGVIVHKPNHFSTTQTVVDWVISHYHDIESVGYIDRPGIVHRLDKDTSGLLIIPRTNVAHAHFSNLFKNREIQKTYIAVVQGAPPREGTIDYPLGRHPTVRMKRLHYDSNLLGQPGYESLRSARTHFKTTSYYEGAALVTIQPVTGRTHQIRVHMASQRHPIIGDTVYGTSSPAIQRHALHAYQLSFTFEETPFIFKSPLPKDMVELIQFFEKKSELANKK